MGRSIGFNKYISNDEQLILPKWSLESWLLSFLLFVFYVEIKFDFQDIDVIWVYKLLYLSIDLMVHYDIHYDVYDNFYAKESYQSLYFMSTTLGYNVSKLGTKR